MTAHLRTIDTPDGPFTLLEEDGAVLASGWTADADAIVARLRPAFRPSTIGLAEPGSGSAATAAVRDYYAGDLSAIDAVPVSQAGTAMQLAGWAALRSIPAGEVLTYTAFAERSGSPGAVRAAASICARNAAALFVPCHRVIRTGGGLGGFAWGLEVKERLLARESAILQSADPQG